MTHATINYRGIELLCSFDYDPPESRTNDHPGSPANAQLETCIHKGEDIKEILTNEQIDEIEGLCVESMEEGVEA